MEMLYRKKRPYHHLNIKSVLSKIYEMRKEAKLSNTIIIEACEI